MGSKISEMLTDKEDYDSCVNIMREFTADTAKAFENQGLMQCKSVSNIKGKF